MIHLNIIKYGNIMLKKLCAAVLLLAITATANANPISPLSGINGMFDISLTGDLLINNDGTIAEIDFNTMEVGSAPNNTFYDASTTQFLSNDFFGPLEEDDTITIGAGTLNTSLFVTDTLLWSIAGYEFYISEITDNHTSNNITGLTIIGTLKKSGFDDTRSQYFISGQTLHAGIDNTSRSFSATVTSPAPPVISEEPPVEVSAPGTLALFGLALVGFAASRRQKKSV